MARPQAQKIGEPHRTLYRNMIREALRRSGMRLQDLNAANRVCTTPKGDEWAKTALRGERDLTVATARELFRRLYYHRKLDPRVKARLRKYAANLEVRAVREQAGLSTWPAVIVFPGEAATLARFAAETARRLAGVGSAGEVQIRKRLRAQLKRYEGLWRTKKGRRLARTLRANFGSDYALGLTDMMWDERLRTAIRSVAGS
jgi:hypothetical protein